ncbi:MAG: ParB/RepB/Spo0J family partition protein [Alphaproteobacteria bacterium]|nr:ParB/RepB/Spo0J family partition protein [Alphaproteobacteria bacterium]
MKIEQIAIADIEVKDRLRPVTLEAVKGLAEDIRNRGLRQPVEVAAIGGGRYRLVAGAHRLAACQSIDMETIPAFVVVGTEANLRRSEILENITRNELNVLERVQFLAELKRLYQEENPEATKGGDRRSEEFQSANVGTLKDWYAEVAIRSDRAVRTIKREASIGFRLDKEAVDVLRATDIADNQKELEALSRLEPKMQREIAWTFTYLRPPRSVAQAVKAIEGRSEPDETDPVAAQFHKLLDTWTRNDNAKARRQFLDQLIEDGVLAEGCIKKGRCDG